MQSVYQKLTEIEKSGEPAALCVIIKTSGSTPLKAGAKMIVWPDGKIFGTIGGGKLEYKVIENAIAVLNNCTAETFVHHLVQDHQMCCGGSVHIYIETVKKINKLIIFGGGHIGKQVLQFARTLDFQVSIVDERATMLEPMKDQGAALFQMHHQQYLTGAAFDGNSFIVICTHLHHYDREILAYCINKPLAYLGMVGSMRKVSVTKKIFLKQGLATEEELGKVDMPMGFNIGGNSPEEIAISVVAKLVAVKNNKMVTSEIGKENKGTDIIHEETNSDSNRCW